MKSDKKLVVANWKANPDTLKLAKENLNSTKKFAAKYKNVETVVCPPTIFLESLKSSAKPVILGSQDFFPEASGAHTGSTGYAALLETKIKYAIIGHSERRAMGEDNIFINKKVKAALATGVKPILCVGESKRDPNLEYLGLLKLQLSEAFKEVPKSRVKDVVVAYEPVWAIGDGAKRDAKPTEIEEIIIFIKRVIGDIYKTSSVPPVKIIYGGSVSTNNAEDILKISGADGFLVGRASLTPKVFGEIIRIAGEFK